MGTTQRWTLADAWPRVLVFLGLLVLLTSGFWALSWLAALGKWSFGGPKTRELFVTGLMWCPGVAALLACALLRTPLSSLGMRLPRIRYLGFGYAYPVLYLALAYAAIWCFGLGTPDIAPMALEAGKRFTLQASPVVLVMVSIAITASIGVLAEVGRSLGEELGWRGFLVPELCRRHRLGFAGVLSGIVWGLWHFPLFLASGFDGIPAWYALACFLLAIVPLGYVCAWLRWRSGSVWPAVMLHSVHNALLYPVFDAITVADGEAAGYFIGEMGAALAVVNLTGALLLWRATRRPARARNSMAAG
jgi:membrane protease YdiL (CAAX protease family)